jgi:hypothetical protein
MKKLALSLTFTIVLSFVAQGQYNYDVDNIADSLKLNANAVIRFHNTSYKRISAEKYTTEVHYAITILNPNGKQASELRLYYDRNSHVSDIKGSLYNGKGVLQGKLKKKEIRDYAANNNYTLFSDNRVKFFKPAITSFPYTIEFEYVIENSGIVGFDTWTPQEWFNISVETAELSFTVPNEYDIKYVELNHDFNRDVKLSDNLKVYTWSVKNLKALQYEAQAPNYLNFMCAVLLSPNEFVYEGSKGDFSTWESYGKWTYDLINGRDQLSEETVKFIKDLTDTIPIKKDKAKAIYQYMQSKTRYVNIALGIGGFQPILAMDVDAKGYGDCKGLSNYTKALLNCAGIVSYYTEIGTGKYQEIKFTDFASANQTNHIILCVPFENDTVWLECTNQNIPFGFLTPGSQNRYALLIKPNGGELVKTPSFNVNQNTRISNINIQIDAMGDACFELSTEYNCNQYTDIFSLLNSSPKEQKDELQKHLSSSKSIKIQNFSLNDNSKINPKAKLHAKGEIYNYTSKTNTMILFSADFFHSNNFFDFIPDNRNLDIFEPYSYSYIDTLRIAVPKGYSPESLPNSVEFNSVYGQCSYKVEQIGETIIIVRKLAINQGQYNCALFDEINEFLQHISDFENRKIIVSDHTH